MLISFSVKDDPTPWCETNGRAHRCFRTWKISTEGNYTVSVVTLKAQSASLIPGWCSVCGEKLGGIRLFFDVSPCIQHTKSCFLQKSRGRTEKCNQIPKIFSFSPQSASPSCPSLRPCSQCLPRLCLGHPSSFSLPSTINRQNHNWQKSAHPPRALHDPSFWTVVECFHKGWRSLFTIKDSTWVLCLPQVKGNSFLVPLHFSGWDSSCLSLSSEEHF